MSYERTDMNPKALGCIGLMLVLSLVISSIATAMLYRAFSVQTQEIEGPITVPVPKTEAQFPSPQLQLSSPEDLAKFRKQEDEILNEYHYKNGKVTIPIDRAMELIVKEKQAPLAPGPTWPEMMKRRAEEGTRHD